MGNSKIQRMMIAKCRCVRHSKFRSIIASIKTSPCPKLRRKGLVIALATTYKIPALQLKASASAAWQREEVKFVKSRNLHRRSGSCTRTARCLDRVWQVQKPGSVEAIWSEVESKISCPIAFRHAARNVASKTTFLFWCWCMAWSGDLLEIRFLMIWR